MNRFLLIFLGVLLTLFSLEMLAPVQAAVIHPFTSLLAKISAFLTTFFDQDVVSEGRLLIDQPSGFAVSIESGCNGVEATIVLIAAVLAFPAPWRARITTIIAGFFAIQALNIVRIISLFYLGQWNEEIFAFSHLYLWPALIMLDVLLVFLVYLHVLGRQEEVATAEAAA